jgi:hypothetical protein
MNFIRLSISGSRQAVMKMKAVWVLIIFSFFSAPAVLTLAGIRIGAPVQRGKLEMPSIREFELKDNKVDYVLKFGRWFDGNNALEGFYVRLWNQVEWSVFGVSRELLKGRDGWEIDKETALKLLPDSDKIGAADLEQTIGLIKRFQNHLEKRGIHFLIVVIPFKSTVYPEKYIQAGVEPRINTGLDRFQRAFAANAIPFIDAQKILIENKDRGVYYKTDLHFNSLGAYLVSTEILKHFYSTLKIPMPSFPEPEVKRTRFTDGSANNAMPLLVKLSEDVPTVTLRSNDIRDRVQVRPDQESVARFVSKRADIALLPPSIMFGNSFMLPYSDVGYHDYYSKSLRILDYQFFNKALDYIEDDTKILILQIYETQLLFHLPYNNGFNYWDKRVYDLPLPDTYEFKSPG